MSGRGRQPEHLSNRAARIQKPPEKRIIKSPVAGREYRSTVTREQKHGELSTSFLRLAPVPDDLKARQDRQTSGDVASLLEASPCVANPIPKFPLGCFIQRSLASELFIGNVAARVEADQCSGLLLVNPSGTSQIQLQA